MALINDNKKFIFFHLYKCAGTSIRTFINENTPETYEIHTGHSLPIDMSLQLEFDNKNYNEYFKFTFVRNPFDFIVSTYFYAKRFSNHFMHKDIIDNNMDIEKFISYYMNFRNKHIKDENLFGKNRVVTYKDFLLDEKENLLVDYVGKVENLNNDLSFISERIGIKNKKIPFLNINPNEDKDYRKYFSEKAKKLMYENFEWELNYFNYKF